MVLLLSALSLAHAADGDQDGVPDADDLCKWEDDSVDLDANYVPDCFETILPEFGFSSALATQANYEVHWPFHSLSWDATDLNGYNYLSGSALVGVDDWNMILGVRKCIPVTHGVIYAVMGQFTTDQVGQSSIHDIFLQEFKDLACQNAGDWAYPAAAYRNAGDPVLPLVGTYQPSAPSVKAIRVYASGTAGVDVTSWFDNLSMHPISDVDPGDPSTN